MYAGVCKVLYDVMVWTVGVNIIKMSLVKCLYMNVDARSNNMCNCGRIVYVLQ